MFYIPCSMNRGVSLILAILILGSVVAIAAAISFLMFQEIKISGDVAYSTRAFYAADTGVEAALNYYKSLNRCLGGDGSGPAGGSGSATYGFQIDVEEDKINLLCKVTIESTGKYKNVQRKIRINFEDTI